LSEIRRKKGKIKDCWVKKGSKWANQCLRHLMSLGTLGNAMDRSEGGKRKFRKMLQNQKRESRVSSEKGGKAARGCNRGEKGLNQIGVQTLGRGKWA